jgi:hypothetical protein
MKIKGKKNKKTTEDIKEILVVNAEVVKCEGAKLCYPEGYFEMIEQCKLCGKCG